MAHKHFYLSLIMCAVVGYTTWMAWPSYRPTKSAPSSSDAPDAFMENIIAVIMNKEGRPNIKVITPKLVHYAKNNVSKLMSPQMAFYLHSSKPWLISATYAQATQGIDAINLWDNVKIQHPADEHGPATLITTSALTVHPQAQMADTAMFITLVQQNVIVKATGMHANMGTGAIDLLSEARGEYVPS